MANRNRDAGREGFWRATLKRQAASGLSVREFCRREDLAESNFYAWRRTIAERDQETSPTRRARRTAGRDGKTGLQKTAPAFVPVAVNGRSEHEAGVVLELGGGRRLRFAESIEPLRLAAFVHALETEAAS
jgi:hypothetical protein